MKKLSIACLVALSSLLPVSVVEAALITYDAILNGAQRVPSTSSTATGFGIVTVDTDTSLLTLDLTWTGLAAPAGGGHLHCCAPPTGTGMLAINFPLFPAAISGTYSRTVDLTLSSTYFVNFLNARAGDVTLARSDLLAGLASGTAYLDIPNANFQNGEIRGNLAAVPEPTTMLLIGTGLAGMAVRRRIRR